MELSKIEKLLERYLDAETTVQEEATLKNYFLSGNVAPHLQEYESMFSYFKYSKEEKLAKPIQLNTKKTNWKWLSVAASVVLLVSVYFGGNVIDGSSNGPTKEQLEQYAQVKDVLKMLSSNLNKGNEAVASLYTYEDTVNKILK